MHNTHLEYFKKSECEKRVEDIFIKTNESKVSKAFIYVDVSLIQRFSSFSEKISNRQLFCMCWKYWWWKRHMHWRYVLYLIYKILLKKAIVFKSNINIIQMVEVHLFAHCWIIQTNMFKLELPQLPL